MFKLLESLLLGVRWRRDLGSQGMDPEDRSGGGRGLGMVLVGRQHGSDAMQSMAGGFVCKAAAECDK